MFVPDKTKHSPMKLTSTLTILASLFFVNLFAQTGPGNLTISISGGAMPQHAATITVGFSSAGANAADATDIIYPSTASQGSAVVPFTFSSDSVLINGYDSRPQLDSYSTIHFGIASNHVDTMTINASFLIDTFSANLSTNKEISFVYLEDLSTGSFYSIFNANVSIPVPVDTTYGIKYKLHVMVRATINAIDATCLDATNGSVFMENTNCTNWDYVVFQNGIAVQASTVFTNDTTVSNILPGNYSVAVYNNNLLADSVQLTVQGPVQIVPGFTADNYSVFVGDNISFTNNSTGAVSYSWSFGDSTTDTDEDVVHSFATAGTFVVTLTATNQYGCQETFTDSVFVSVSPFMHAGPSFSQSFNNSADDAAAERHSNDATIYAAEKSINVNQHTGGQKVTIEIMTMNGQLISSASETDQLVSFSVSETGIYVVNVIYMNGKVITKKVMVY
jgi:PKD repeat protein